MYKVLISCTIWLYFSTHNIDCTQEDIFYNHRPNGSDDFIQVYNYFSETERLLMREKVKEMFYFGYDNYMKYAFPLDELNPILCTGRGPDKANPDNININDVLGGYSLTLVDTLDTLAIIGNQSEFKHAVNLIKSTVNFNLNSTVQVFEAAIRVLGGLLAAHLLMVDPKETFGSLRPIGYNDELLHLSHDLANRLLQAFEGTGTGLPWPRVNLIHGIPPACASTTCTAGAGTLVLEFGILGRLLGDPTLESQARRVVDSLWSLRSNQTGLFGNVVDIHTGRWVGKMSGLGAGIDSFYEYLLKSYIVFGKQLDLERFNDIYEKVNRYMRKGRSSCNNGTGDVPLFVNVNMDTGETANTWIDSLQAAFTGVQVLRGDVEEAICSHAIYYGIWKKYGALPERFNWQMKAPDVKFYPLRPEFSEATYLLYQATKHPFYLHVGSQIVDSLNTHAKVQCGYATLHDVVEKSTEDRMESFFLSETVKYLFLLFDFENPLNKEASKWIFSTEGHIFKLNKLYRDNYSPGGDDDELDVEKSSGKSPSVTSNRWNVTLDSTCTSYEDTKFAQRPLQQHYFAQIDHFVGLI